MDDRFYSMGMFCPHGAKLQHVHFAGRITLNCAALVVARFCAGYPIRVTSSGASKSLSGLPSW